MRLVVSREVSIKINMNIIIFNFTKFIYSIIYLKINIFFININIIIY